MVRWRGTARRPRAWAPTSPAPGGKSGSTSSACPSLQVAVARSGEHHATDGLRRLGGLESTRPAARAARTPRWRGPVQASVAARRRLGSTVSRSSPCSPVAQHVDGQRVALAAICSCPGWRRGSPSSWCTRAAAPSPHRPWRRPAAVASASSGWALRHLAPAELVTGEGVVLPGQLGHHRDARQRDRLCEALHAPGSCNWRAPGRNSAACGAEADLGSWAGRRTR